MGSGQSLQKKKRAEEAKEAEALAAKNREIEKQLLEEQMARKKDVRLLLLGTSDSGKSTILKQMKIIHNIGFTMEERLLQRFPIYNNIIMGMAVVLRGMRESPDDVQLEDSLQEQSRVLFRAVNRCEQMEAPTREVVKAIKALWLNPEVKRAVREGVGGGRGGVGARGNVVELPQNCAYFFDHIERVSSLDFVPTDQDILMSRVKTTGIVEVMVPVKKLNIRIFDVGGQRSERKKWMHCFEGINAIIFISAISEFDQVLVEDSETNRLVESVNLFEMICNARWFVLTSMILFLNKIDIFGEKIQRKTIREAFPEYEGSNSFDDQVDFLKRKFKGSNRRTEKPIFIHKTCATNTNQMKLILEDVIEVVSHTNLQKSGVV